MADVDENETKSATLRLRDEDGEVRRAFVAEVARAIEAGDRSALHDLAADLHQSDVGALLEALEHDERPRLIELMGSDFDFAALTEVDDKVREDILEELPTETVVEGVRELENDDAVTILEYLNREDQVEILDALPAVERVALQRSLDYPENSAGRLMQTTLVRAPAFWTAGQTLDHIHDVDDDDLPDSFFEIFVVDPAHRLLGNVFLDRLVRAKRSARLDELMDPDRRRVHVNDDQEEVARFFERYNLISAPVVDDADRLMGVITIDDIVDVIREEASEDMGALGGVSAEEELSDTVWWTAKNRFLWLFVNLVTAFMASSVIGMFEGQVQKMVALAVLVPIVASQGGNAATQTMTVAVRALATRELSRANAMRVVRRELMVGCINGLGFGLLTGLMAGAWFGLPSLGIVIGLAMLTNMIAGALGGILIPMILDRYEADPAVSSGAFVTTVTDVVGNFSFLGIATLWFGLG
ncbi:MAG: magnesium transporter [Hyphomicrobiales bacterium]|nr:magnesium transporter [Hyphomicrobiales bacterium]